MWKPEIYLRDEKFRRKFANPNYHSFYKNITINSHRFRVSWKMRIMEIKLHAPMSSVKPFSRYCEWDTCMYFILTCGMSNNLISSNVVDNCNSGMYCKQQERPFITCYYYQAYWSYRKYHVKTWCSLISETRIISTPDHWHRPELMSLTFQDCRNTCRIYLAK